MEREAIVLAEYGEAGDVYRAQEQYARATLGMYLVFPGGLLALTASE